MSLLHRLDHWIFDAYPVSVEGLGIYRITYAAFVLLVIGPGHSLYGSYTWIAAYPDQFFLPPPGPMQLFSGFPPRIVFEVLHVLLLGSLTALLFGYRARAASILVSLLFLAGMGFSYSFGKINHTMLFVLLPFVMAFSGWGGAYALDARTGRTQQAAASPLALLALMIGFAMFTAGFTKLIGGWLGPTTQATQGHLVKQFFTRGRQDLLAPFFLSLDSAFFWEGLDYLTVLFEAGFLVVAFHPTWMRRFAAAAVLFHTGTVLMLNIAFTFNLIVYAAFLDWDAVHAWWQRRARPMSLSRGGWLAVMAATAVFFYAVGSPLLWLDDYVAFTSDLTLSDVVAHGVALGVVLLVLASRARRPVQA